MRSLFNSVSGYLGHAHQQQHRHVVVGVGEEVHGLHHHLPQHKVLIVTSFHFILGTLHIMHIFDFYPPEGKGPRRMWWRKVWRGPRSS